MKEDIKNLREILAEMHRIGCNWHEELVFLREENRLLKDEICKKLKIQAKWQENFVNNISSQLENSLSKKIHNDMENALKSPILEAIGGVKETIASLSSIKTDVSSLKTDLNQLPKKSDLDLVDFRNQIAQDMKQIMNSLKDDLPKDTGDKLSKEDIAMMINNSLANLLSDARNKVLSSSVTPPADIENEPQPTSVETNQESLANDFLLSHEGVTMSQTPENEENSDGGGPLTESNGDDAQIFSMQKQTEESFNPSAS